MRPRRSRSVLRGESTTTYASSKLNRAGRRAARYDSGLEAHKYNRPARKRPTPHRIAHGQVACSRSRCGNLSTLPLSPVNIHSQTFGMQPTLEHNHARYDAENHLVTTAGLSYLYDGDGRRVAKKSGSTVSKIYWYGQNGEVLDETDGTGSVSNSALNEYVFFGGQRVARRDSSNNVDYYFADHLGTARVVANSSGSILDDSDFYPFGGERVITSSSGNNYKFTGKERDSESGLDNFGARYNSSQLGRFMTPDWSAKPQGVPYAVLDEPQSLNLYAYVRNNPLSRVDLDGHNDYLWQKLKNWAKGNGFKTNAQVQGLSVAQTAANHRGDKDWATNGFNRSGGDTGHPHDFLPKSNKCNEFVGDTLAEAGKKRPEITDSNGNTRMPTAHELADPNVHIPGLSDPKPLSDAQPGDVIAQAHGVYGHAGIVVAPGETASANTAGDNGGKITVNEWGFRTGPIVNGMGPNGESATDPAPVVRTPQ